MLAGAAPAPPPTWGTSSPRPGGSLLQSRVSCLQGGLPSAATSIQTGSLMPTMQPLPGSSPGFCAGWDGEAGGLLPQPCRTSFSSSRLPLQLYLLKVSLTQKPRSGCPLLPLPATQASTCTLLVE